MTPDEVMKALEEATVFTAWLTGVRNDLVAKGWNEHNAERLVIAMMQNMQGGTK